MNARSFWGHIHRHPHHHGLFAAGRRGSPFGGDGFGGGNPFRGGGNPFHGNPFQRRGGRARRGDVRTAILVLLAEEPRNGYQLMTEIERRSEGVWRPSPGSTYPALQQLEDEGLVRVETEGGGRTFHLTDRGREAAAALKESAPPWAEAASQDPTDLRELAQLIRQVSVAAMQVAQAGTAPQVTEARKVLVEARRALYRLLAEDGDDE